MDIFGRLLGSFLNPMWALAGLPWFRLWTRRLIVHAIVTAKTWAPIGHPNFRYSFGITAPLRVTTQRFRYRTRIRSFLIHSFIHSTAEEQATLIGLHFPAVPYCLTELLDMVRTTMFTCSYMFLRGLFSLMRTFESRWMLNAEYIFLDNLVKSHKNLKSL